MMFLLLIFPDDDVQVLSRDFMPKSMLEQYLACDKPPPLDKLNPYREVSYFLLDILLHYLNKIKWLID
jgi:hypothetical protein